MRALSVVVIGACLCGWSHAQTLDESPKTVAQSADISAEPEAPAQPPRRGQVELSYGAARLTGGNTNWSDYHLGGHVVVAPGSTLNWELASERHFGERGTLGVLAFTQDLSDRLMLIGQRFFDDQATIGFTA